MENFFFCAVPVKSTQVKERITLILDSVFHSGKDPGRSSKNLKLCYHSEKGSSKIEPIFITYFKFGIACLITR